MQRYAAADVSAAGRPTPCSDDLTQLAAVMSQAGEHFFLPGDPNWDNQKRNLAIQAYIQFEMPGLFSRGREWCLRQLERREKEPWLQEWIEILDRGDPSELADILLSPDQDRVRQRSSMVFAEEPDYGTVLRIKRLGVA
jgi:hypothetical protein